MMVDNIKDSSSKDFLFSVLMSIYKKEKPEYLRQALDSILHQTVMPAEIVIVEDGPLTGALYGTLDEYEKRYPIIRRIVFSQNRGLGLALRDGVLACRYEWIARMDTDDIAKPERFEKQITFLKKHPNVALLGTGIEEFSISPDHPDSQTILPQDNETIICYAKRRNPFRHMTMMLRKQAVLESGNYRNFLWFEDYDLWVRMLRHGFVGANLPEILVSVRASMEMFKRRGGWGYLQQDIKFQKFLFQNGNINIFTLFENILLRSSIRIIPNDGRVWVYRMFLRSHKKM